MKAQQIEIESDDKTVWINSDISLGRFSRMGIDVHKPLEQQMKGDVCLDCKPGPCTLEDWQRFKAAIKQAYNFEVDDKHMPEYLHHET